MNAVKAHVILNKKTQINQLHVRQNGSVKGHIVSLIKNLPLYTHIKTTPLEQNIYSNILS